MTSPRQYRKKPVVIEAIEVTAENWEAVRDWCGGRSEPDGVLRGVGLKREHHAFSVATLEGHMTARFGDFIIRGVAGEFYPCRRDIFAKTYDPVDGDDLTARGSHA